MISILKEGIPASTSEKKIIDYLRNDQNLSNEVINVIIDYCLHRDEPCFNKGYVSTVASSLIINKKYKTCLDALDYFYGPKKKKTKEKNDKTNIINNEVQTQEIQKNEPKFVSRFNEKEELLKELENRTNGKR